MYENSEYDSLVVKHFVLFFFFSSAIEEQHAAFEQLPPPPIVHNMQWHKQNAKRDLLKTQSIRPTKTSVTSMVQQRDCGDKKLIAFLKQVGGMQAFEERENDTMYIFYIVL